jgi:Ni,Fe-hydrogenase III large subunit
MRGKSPRAAARFAARLSAEATVAHAIAFARATEAALQCEPPPRAVAWRGVMAELERIVCHLGDLAAIANAAGFAILSTRCSLHAEALHRAAALAFGHRLMMDCVIPGGIAADVAVGGPEAIGRALATLAAELPELQRLYRSAAVVRHLSGVGTVSPEQVMRFAAGGVIGRAAGRTIDVRRAPGYAPYSTLGLEVSVLPAGDVEARTRIRLDEIAESIRLMRSLLAALPEGAVSVAPPSESGEGIGFSESARGDVWHWLRLDHGQIASVFMRDPAWAHWPLLEAAMAGGQSEDLPLVQASFGLASSGVDL